MKKFLFFILAFVTLAVAAAQHEYMTAYQVVEVTRIYDGFTLRAFLVGVGGGIVGLVLGGWFAGLGGSLIGIVICVALGFNWFGHVGCKYTVDVGLRLVSHTVPNDGIRPCIEPHKTVYLPASILKTPQE